MKLQESSETAMMTVHGQSREIETLKQRLSTLLRAVQTSGVRVPGLHLASMRDVDMHSSSLLSIEDHKPHSTRAVRPSNGNSHARGAVSPKAKRIQKRRP